MLLILTAVALSSAAQRKDFPGKTIRTPPVSKLQDVTITGNIKQLNLQGAMIDAFAFMYTDLITGKEVAIPLERDSSGNYSVKVPVQGPYQQIQLVQGQKISGEVIFGGLITHEFYVKPGEPMEFNFYISPDHSKSSVGFKGNIAAVNAQEKSYQRSLSSVDLSIMFDYSKLDSVKAETYADFKKYVSERLQAALLFNKAYFKQHPVDLFLQQQADNDLRYEAAKLVIQGIFKSKTTDPGLTTFLNENKIKIWNPLALGNDRYKTFIDQYYLLMERSAQKVQGDYTVMFRDVAAYILKKHPELSAADKALALKFSDSTIIKTEKESAIFNDRLMSSYASEYTGIIDTRFMYNYLMKTSDPDLRNLFLTRLLQEKVENEKITSVQPLIERYKRTVKEGPFKEAFLKKYADLYQRTVQNKLQPGCVIADASLLREGKVFDDLIGKYKGKVVYIDIWATWCQPCLMEMKNSQILREKLRGKDVAFVYLCISSPQEPLWKKLIALHAIEGENYWLSDKQREELNRTFSIRSVPRHLLVDKQGKVSDQDAPGPGSSKTVEAITTLLDR